MVRLLSEYFLENLAGLLLVSVGLVSWERRCVEREGVEHRRLAVLRIADVQTLHRLFVGEAARAVIKLVGISIERLDRGDVVSLAFGARPEGLRLFHGHPPLLEGRRVRRLPEWIPEAHRDSPVRHGARGVRRRAGSEGLDPFRVPEG